MKIRVLLLTGMLLAGYCLKAQPPSEVIYQGTLIAAGFKQNIPAASDGPFPLGFNFTFFGNPTPITEFWVSANGLVIFNDPADPFNTSADIPTAVIPNNYIAPFWDNLSIVDGGNVLYRTIGASPNRKCIIQFKNMGFDPIPTPLGTFAVILHETTNVIKLQYRLFVDPYSPKSHGLNATIGLENAAGTAGVKYAFHDGNAVHSGDAISFTPSGTTYTVNPDATYDPVLLTTNTTLPDPGIVTLISPSVDAVIGSDHTFEWGEAANAATYYLVVDVTPDLSSATFYNAGSNLSYDITGLTLDQTYYWAVFSSNATAMTWGEVNRFSTSSTPPLTAVAREIWVAQGDERKDKLQYTGGDASAKTAVVTSLPAEGQLWQVSGVVKSSQITSVPTIVTHPEYSLIYVASGSTGTGAGNFNFKFQDDTGESPEATVKINVTAAGVPNYLVAARNTGVEIQFDRIMNDPAGKEGQFTLTVNGSPVVLSSASLKEGDPYTIVLTPAIPLNGSETVFVSYTKGTVSATTGGLLETFTDQPVTLLAQTITFTTNLNKKFGDPPFSLSGTSTSGSPFTWSSSNLSVATIPPVGNTVTITGVGSSQISALQDGDETYAPARYTRTMTVAKGDQTITFGSLDEKTYGDADFTISATASSGLSVSFSGNNNAVATVTGSLIHISGGGNVVITASQPGNALWNPAPPVPQILIINKVDITFTAHDKTKPYLAAIPDLTWSVTGFISGEDQSVLDVSPEAVTSATVSSDVGDYTITFSGGSDNSYNYLFENGILTITKIDQTITFTDVPDRLLRLDTYMLAASSTSGLTVLFESMNTSIATVSGNQLTGLIKGIVDIRAYNEGDQNYNPAELLASVEITNTHRDIMHLFTPNSDGHNDLWELPELYNTWGKCNVKVYNRWGKLVFADKDYNGDWNGMSDGKDVPEGAYYFIIETENSGTITGTVNIVR